jgi:hypothetical protein
MSAITSVRVSRRTRVVAAVAGAVALGIVASAVPVQAMGTGNPYEDQQVGVTYTVYEPSYTASMKTPKTAAAGPTCPTGTEAVLLVEYRSASGRNFTVTEGNPMCSDIGIGAVVATPTIKGAKASVVAYCDPESTTPCTRADVKKYGGHLEVVLPAASGLRSTTVWIETYGTKNITARKLIRIARSMTPVG